MLLREYKSQCMKVLAILAYFFLAVELYKVGAILFFALHESGVSVICLMLLSNVEPYFRL